MAAVCNKAVSVVVSSMLVIAHLICVCEEWGWLRFWYTVQ